MILDAHANGQLSETHTPDAHLGSLLRQRVYSAGRNDHHRIVHRCLKDVHQGYAVVDDFHCLTELQRCGLTLVLTETAHGRLRSRRVLNLYFHPCLAVEALRLGHVIAGKLRLRRPLGREHDRLVLCLHFAAAKGKESSKHHQKPSILYHCF